MRVGASGTRVAGTEMRNGRRWAPTAAAVVSLAVAGTACSQQGASSADAGKGWNATQVTVGITTSKDAKAAAAAAGIAGIDPGDLRGWASAVVDDINKSGGILGRKVVLQYQDEPLSQQAVDPNGTAQATCTAFTQDHPVAAVIDFNLTAAPLLPCLSKSGVPLVGMAPAAFDDGDYSTSAGTLFQPGQASYTQVIAPWVERLAANGYLTQDARVGVLRSGSDAGKRLGAQINKELTARGFANASEFIHTDDPTKIGTEMASAVLQFRRAGVNRILLTNGLSAIFFPMTAERQGYRPRYAVTTAISPALVAANVPVGQFQGAVGVGWLPAFDVLAPDEAQYETQEGTKCATLMSAAGHPIGTGSNRWVPRALCDAFASLKAAAVAGNGLDSAAIARGFNDVGTTIGSANTFSQRFASGRHYGASQTLDLRFDAACRCFKYLDGTQQPIP